MDPDWPSRLGRGEGVFVLLDLLTRIFIPVRNLKKVSNLIKDKCIVRFT